MRFVWADLLNPGRDGPSADELGFDQAVENVVENSARTKATRYADHVLTVYATRWGFRLDRRGCSPPGCRSSCCRTVTVRTRGSRAPVLDIDEVVRHWDDNADLLRKGSPALLHGILDVVVDGQFDTIQQLDDAIESLRTTSSTTARRAERCSATPIGCAGARRTPPDRAADARVVNTIMRRSTPGTTSSGSTAVHQTCTTM